MPAPTIAPTITLRRADWGSPLRRRIASLMMPPEVSPTTPAKNTAEEMASLLGIAMERTYPSTSPLSNDPGSRASAKAIT